MRIRLNSLTHAKRVGKSLQSHFPELKLSVAQLWAAKLLGYQDFHDLETEHKKPGEPSPDDNQLDANNRLERFVFQVEQMMALAAIDRDRAEDIVIQVAPSGRMFDTTSRTILQGSPELRQFTPPLQAFSDAVLAKDFKRAAGIAPRMSNTSRQHVLADVSMGFWQEAVHKRQTPPDRGFLVALKTFADAGDLMAAYNYANHLQEQKPKGWATEAAAYYQKVIHEADQPDRRGAAIVNYTSLIRDGEISGTPDWPAAVELYEEAGQLGMLVGFLNAGNVSTWLLDQGLSEYGARAARNYQRVLDDHAAGKALVTTLAPPEVSVLYDARHCLLHLHLKERFQGADLQKGLKLARPILGRESCVDDDYERGVHVLLQRMSAPKRRTPADHWLQILSTLGWSRPVGGAMRLRTLDVNGFRLDCQEFDSPILDGSSIRVVVVNWPCLPVRGGLGLLLDLADKLSQEHTSGLILLPQKGLFIWADDRCHTLAVVAKHGVIEEPWPVSINYFTHSSECLFQQALDKTVFGSEAKYGASGCMIPIAVNVLDERAPLSKYCVGNAPYVPVGSVWRMPYARVEELEKHGIRVDLAEGTVEYD